MRDNNRQQKQNLPTDETGSPIAGEAWMLFVIGLAFLLILKMA